MGLRTLLMHPLSSRVARVRGRLAFVLGLRAVTGLSAFALLALVLAASAVWCGASAWDALTRGAVGIAVISAIGFLLSIALTVRCLLWLSAPAPCPGGVCVPYEAARPLHRMVRRIGSRLGGAAVDAIWIGGDMNAAILQRPRWGCFGRMESHLIIGLPLVHSVSRRQFSAILAHEFAHLAYQRQGAAAWWSHFRAWWFRVLDRCIEDTRWFGRLLERWSEIDLRGALRLARLDEFEADAGAARAVGAGLVGEALVEVALKERFLSEDYWRKVMAQSRLQPQPSIRPYREMGLGVMAGFRRPLPGAVDIRELFDDGGFTPDFHPSLVERLAALRVGPSVSHGERITAADAYLAPLLPALSLVFDRAWWQGSRTAWRRAYQLSRLV